MEYQEDSQIASQQPCKILSALVRKRPGKVTGTRQQTQLQEPRKYVPENSIYKEKKGQV